MAAAGAGEVLAGQHWHPSSTAKAGVSGPGVWPGGESAEAF